jgi:signal transduction histidine kinase
MARRILEGERPRDIPVEAAPVVPMFDWRQVKRWGIDSSRLPPDADIRFRTPSQWETYRWYIIGTIVVVVAQLVLIAALLAQHARRRRAEGTLRRSEFQLRTSYEHIRHLTGRLIAGQEAARASMARDLHDDFCQQLVYVSMGVSGLKTSSGHLQDAQTQDTLDDLEQKTNGMFEGIRRLSHDLHPASLRLLGLAPALKTHCGETAKRNNVQVSFRVEGDLSHLHPDVAVCLFRIAQEALRNGITHGHARRLEVVLSRSADHVELTVTDDGPGFDLEAVRRSGVGLGLVSMEERARIVGGDMEILTGPRRGTTIRIRGPVEPPLSSQPADADLRSPAAS